MGTGTVVVLWLGGRQVVSGRHHARRVRGLRRVPHHAALADDRARLGGQHLRARRGVHGPARARCWTSAPAIARRRRAARSPTAARRAWSSATSPSPTSRSRPVLRDVSLRVPAGHTVAIVGATGSGKSTLVSLMPRLYDPPPGTVFVDGVDVRATCRSRACARPSASCRRRRSCSRRPCARTSRSACPRRLPADEVHRRVEAAARTSPSWPRTWPISRAATTPWSASAASRCRAGRSSARRSRAPWPPSPRILVLDDALSAVDTYTEEEILRGLRAARRHAHHVPRVATASRP